MGIGWRSGRFLVVSQCECDGFGAAVAAPWSGYSVVEVRGQVTQHGAELGSHLLL